MKFKSKQKQIFQGHRGLLTEIDSLRDATKFSVAHLAKLLVSEYAHQSVSRFRRKSSSTWRCRSDRVNHPYYSNLLEHLTRLQSRQGIILGSAGLQERQIRYLSALKGAYVLSQHIVQDKVDCFFDCDIVNIEYRCLSVASPRVWNCCPDFSRAINHPMAGVIYPLAACLSRLCQKSHSVGLIMERYNNNVLPLFNRSNIRRYLASLCALDTALIFPLAFSCDET